MAKNGPTAGLESGRLPSRAFSQSLQQLTRMQKSRKYFSVTESYRDEKQDSKETGMAHALVGTVLYLQTLGLALGPPWKEDMARTVLN